MKTVQHAKRARARVAPGVPSQEYLGWSLGRGILTLPPQNVQEQVAWATAQDLKEGPGSSPSPIRPRSLEIIQAIAGGRA